MERLGADSVVVFATINSHGHGCLGPLKAMAHKLSQSLCEGMPLIASIFRAKETMIQFLYIFVH